MKNCILSLPALVSRKAIIVCFALVLFCGARSEANIYYWFGGSGDVSQVGHWSQSTGNTLGVTWATIPGPGDDVIFDNLSFTAGAHAVTNTAGTFNFHDMKWTGALLTPSFNSNQVINVYGSLTFIAAMTFTGSLNFLSPSGTQTINTNGLLLNGNLNFNAPATWNLVSPLSFNGSITISLGTFNTNSNTIVAGGQGGFVTSGAGICALNLGASVVTCNYFRSNNANYTVNAGTSTITINTNDGSGYALNAKGGDVFNNVILNNPNGNPIAGTSSAVTASFVSLVCVGPIRFTGKLTATSLSLAAASYTLSAGIANLLTVTTSLTTASATCTSPAQLASGTPGTQAFISLPAGVTVNNFIIQDINATSGSPIANNSLDNHNNTNWSFVAGIINTLYWVPYLGVAAGNYSDANHWSMVSGGAPSGCVPTPYTDVFFDAGSGFTAGSKTILLNGDSYCHNMTWAGAAIPPVLNVNSQNLSIYGSLVLQTGMTQTNFFSSLNFNSLGVSAASLIPLTITTNGVVFANSGTARFGGYGNWTLLDAFSTGLNIDLAYGTLNTNNQPVSIANLVDEALVAATYPAVLNLGSSTVTLTAGVFNTNAGNFTFNAGTSTIKSPASSAGLTINSKSGNAYYNVQFDNASGVGTIAGAGSATFNSIIYTTSGGTISSNNNVIGTLILAPGNTYTFPSSSTVSITNVFNGLNPACTSALTTITSSAPPLQATINITNTINGTGIADLAGSTVTGIKVTGTGTMNATGSVDNGSNSININFTFSGASASPLYWVPFAGTGTGNWTDANHWSLTSGGLGGACLPLPGNTVYFDNNSFTGAGQTVTINNTAYADSMIWSGISAGRIPVLANPAGKTLNIYHSLELMAGMTTTGSFILNYKSLNTNPAPASWPTQTINTNGVSIIASTTTFNGNANWNLLNNYTEVGGIGDVVTLGTVNTNGFTYSVRSLTINSATFNAGSSTINLTAGVSTVLSANAAGAAFNAANATINFPGGSAGGGVTANLKAGESVGTINFTGAGNTMNSGGATINSLNFLGNSGIDNLSGSGSIINNAFFKSDGKINSTTNFGNLTLSPNGTYTLTSGVTQNVTGNLIMNGNPCYPITILSSVPGTQATINYTGAPETVAFARIKDIKALPAGAISADNNSTNNGNNTNIVFATGGMGVIGLGPPTLSLTCSQYPHTLNTTLFFPDAAATYAWSTGATTAAIATPAAGSYSVTVFYGNNGNAPLACQRSDNIVLSESFPLATNSGSTSVLQNDPQPLVTFTGSGGTPPYLFTYNINGGPNLTVPSAGVTNLATVAQPTNVLGAFQYNVLSVSDAGGPGCTALSSMAVINVVVVLPVSLTSFTVQNKNGSAMLHWSTAQELNSNYFNIERSDNGNAWTWIGRVSAAGNSSSPTHYSYRDNKPLSGINFYRLRQTDIDGRAAYSATRQISFGLNVNIAVMPNPVKDKLYITNLPVSAELRLLSADGKMLLHRVVKQGDESVNMNGYAQGLYILQVLDKASGRLLGSFEVSKD